MKHEMRMLGSHLLPVADTCAVPAGGALAVDRKLFSGGVTELILREPHIKVIREKVTDIDESRIDAEFKDGVLMVKMPKAAEVQHSTTINIR